jgi:hypothetical protein
MKNLLFIVLLMPLGLMAQKDSIPNFKPYSSGTISGFGYVTGSHPELNIRSSIPQTLRVVDNSINPGKVLMETDSTGYIHVYGDTLSVLKAIIKSYGMKIKE